MREWVGGRLEKGIRDEVYTLRNIKYEATIPAFVDEMRRDKTGQLMFRIQELAARTATHWEGLLSTLINAGASTVCYDGQYFFDTDHSSGDSGTLVNKVSSTHVAALDVTTAAAPTTAEMVAALMGCISYLFKYKDDRGEPINQNAKQFAVMVPIGGATNFLGTVFDALVSQNLSSGQSNALLGTGWGIKVIPNPRLTDTTVFYLFRTDGPMKPFIMQSELGVQTSSLTQGSDEEFKNDRHLFGVKANRNVGYGFWQYAMHATLS
jgi:phage major head subunit gpT-like protein